MGHRRACDVMLLRLLVLLARATAGDRGDHAVSYTTPRDTIGKLGRRG